MIRRAQTLSVLAVAALCVLGACRAGAAEAKAPELGVVRWRWRPPPGASVGMPAADGDDVVATYSHTFVVSLGPDGAQRWKTRYLGVREETPLLTGDLVVVPTDIGLIGLDRTTGQIRWDAHLGHSRIEVPDPDDAASTPVVAGRMLLTCSSGGSLFAVDAASGALRWRQPLAGRTDGPPATDGKTVVVTWDPERGDGAGIAAFDVVSGAKRWSAGLHAGAVSAPAVQAAGGRPYAVAVDYDLAAKAFDLGDGHRVWTTHTGGAGSPEVPPLALGDGRVLVADRLAGLTLLDAKGHGTWSARARAAAVRGGPVGPTAAGAYALPLYNGKVLLAAPGGGSAVVETPGGPVSGVAVGPGGTLLVSSAQGADNQLVAYRAGAGP